MKNTRSDFMAQQKKPKKTIRPMLLLFLCWNIHAQTSWVDLKHNQQKMLLPFQSEWDKLDKKTQVRLIRNTDKWLKMSALEKLDSREKLNRFKLLPPDQQKDLKKKVDRYKKLTKEEKKHLKKAHQVFQSMSPEQKRKLRRRYNQMSPKGKKKALNQLKRRGQLKDFINQFDIELRKPIIEMFKNFTPQKRMKFRRHLKTLSFKQRHDLTLELLDMDSASRSLYLDSLQFNRFD